MASAAAEACARYDVWCDVRDVSSGDLDEEADEVERLRLAFEIACRDVRDAPAPHGEFLAVTEALLDSTIDDFDTDSGARIDGTATAVSKRASRVLEAVGDVVLQYLTCEADRFDTPDAEKVVCDVIRTFAHVTSSPRDALLVMQEMLDLRTGQLANGLIAEHEGELNEMADLEKHKTWGWRLVVTILGAMSHLIETQKRDPSLHARDAAPLVQQVALLANAYRDDDETELSEPNWAPITDVLGEISLYKRCVLETLSKFAEEKFQGSERARCACRVALTYAAQDPSHTTVALVTNVLVSRGVTSIQQLFEVSGIVSSGEGETNADEFLAAVAGSVTVANVWDAFPEDNWVLTPFVIAQALDATWRVANTSFSNETRSGLNAVALSFASNAFLRAKKYTGQPDEKHNHHYSLFLKTAYRFETLTLGAPSVKLRELSRVTHARLLTSLRPDMRFEVVKGRVGVDLEPDEVDDKYVAHREMPKPAAAVTALYLSRITREIREILDRRETDEKSQETSRGYVNLVQAALTDALRKASPTEEDELSIAGAADVLVAGLNCFRFVLGRARTKHLSGEFRKMNSQAFEHEMVAYWHGRDTMLHDVVHPAINWAKQMLTAIDAEEKISEKNNESDNGIGNDADPKWCRRMGAEHVLETAGLVAELCEVE